jgi:hypothetical protein
VLQPSPPIFGEMERADAQEAVEEVVVTVRNLSNRAVTNLGAAHVWRQRGLSLALSSLVMIHS